MDARAHFDMMPLNNVRFISLGYILIKKNTSVLQHETLERLLRTHETLHKPDL